MQSSDISSWPSESTLVDSESLPQMIKQYPLVVVDCWAPWCGPCRMISLTIEKLARKYAGKIAFAKLNVSENQKAAKKYKIKAIPTLLVFKNGKIVDRIVGAKPREYFEAKMDSYL